VERNLDNAAIAEQLESFAVLLDLTGASFYTSRAYRRAAETIRDTKAPVARTSLRPDAYGSFAASAPG
jgi:DNA polymerase/3'-5' exonuclease PolX